MKCQPCGQDNASSALFCTACRRPLVAPSKLPTRIEPLAQPAMAAAAPAMATPSSYGGTSDFAPSRNRFAPPNAGRASRMGSDSDVLTDEEAWAAVIGDSNAHHYLTRFERLANGQSGGWHWPAFFVTWYWMLYRKMWLPALFYFLAPYVFMMVAGAVAAASPSLFLVLIAAWWLGVFIVPALMANGWYYGHCKKKIRDIRARGGSKDQMLARLEAAGGTSNVLVIILAVFGIIAGIGILAAVALPAYQTYVMKAKVAEAIPLANEVTAAVGRQFEQTGTLPSQGDVDAIVAHSAHHPRAITGVDLDDVNATVTVRIATGAHSDGSIKYTLTADNNRHPVWTCSTEDLKRYVPASCQP